MDDSAAVSRELARRDMEDISSLRANEAFNRYWMRNLRQRRKIVEESFRTSPREKCDPVQREVLRELLLAYDGLIAIMDGHEAGIKREHAIQAPPGV